MCVCVWVSELEQRSCHQTYTAQLSLTHTFLTCKLQAVTSTEQTSYSGDCTDLICHANEQHTCHVCVCVCVTCDSCVWRRRQVNMTQTSPPTVITSIIHYTPRPSLVGGSYCLLSSVTPPHTKSHSKWTSQNVRRGCMYQLYMSFMPLNQQCQSTDGKINYIYTHLRNMLTE